jgi:uncharacterized YigZ family protein
MKKPSADERAVPARDGLAEIRERASRFLAFAYPSSSPDEAAEAIARLKRKYHDATHVAFAWKIGSGAAAAHRSSDAGEPSGTAGKPIAAAIESAGIGDVLVAVVRYFGGTKLGTGGLSRAYREAAEKAIAAAGTRILRETSLVEVTCPFDRLGAVRRLVRPPRVTVAAESFDASPTVRLEVARSALPALRAALEEARLSYEILGAPCHPEERSDEGSAPRRRQT